MKQRAIIASGMDANPDQHRLFISWMSERFPKDICEGVFRVDNCVAFTHVEYDEHNNAEILGVVALNNWSPTSCEGHIASDGTSRWMTRRFAFTVYDFVFTHAGRSRFNFLVGTKNEKAIGMHDKLGHQRMCLLEDVYGEGKDGYLYGLTKKQWKAGRFAAPKKGG